MSHPVISTAHGVLRGATVRERYRGGQPRFISVTQPSPLATPLGELLPLYEVEDLGRRIDRHLELFADGTLKSLSLQEPRAIPTPAGTVRAERLTFYGDGSLRRVLPLDGKLSGFWNWENEYALAAEEEISTPSGVYWGKILSLLFHEGSGGGSAGSNLRSLALWPKDRAVFSSPIGPVEVRTGMAWHRDGSVRSLEPSRPLPVRTPLGEIHAYDADLVGLTGDENSLEFDPAGQVIALATSTDVLTAHLGDGSRERFEPLVTESLCNPLKNQTYPLLLRFESDGSVEIAVRHSDEPAKRFAPGSARFEVAGRSIALPPALPLACAC